MTPQGPTMCLTTGRLLTEWFEFPHYTDEQIHQMALDHAGVTEEDRPRGFPKDMSPEMEQIHRKIVAFKNSHSGRKWKNNMTQQEVAMRMNEASKMIDPTNFKFLPDDVRERTGLEVNPLWMIECLVRSGLLTPKEQVAALKELASFTHSKAPSISHNTHMKVDPEDWLLELAKEEYEEITPVQPKQPIEKGTHKTFEKRMLQKTKEVDAVVSYGNEQIEEMKAIVDATWEDIDE